MNKSMDRVLADWLHEGPERGPSEGLERALAATRRVGQRPGWTLPERWLPMELTMTRTRSQRPIRAIVMLALLIMASTAAALYVGSQQRQSPAPLFRNGAIVYEQGGDLFIADQLGGTPRPLVAGPEADSGPVFSPQGDRVAFLRETESANVMTVRTDGTDVLVVARIPSIVGLQIDWAPDGGAILVSSDGTFGTSRNGMILIESDGSGSRTIEAGVDVGSGSATWRPDGQHIAFLAESGQVVRAFIADAEGMNARRLPVEGIKNHSGLAWSPDGTRLAAGKSFASTITLVDIDADGNQIESRELLLDSQAIFQRGPSWSPDGRWLAVRLVSGRVGIVASDGSASRTVGPESNGFDHPGVAWSPDGRSLVVMGSSSVLQEDTGTHTWRYGDKVWSVDVATGEQVEVRTPVESWQRLAP